MCIGLARSVLLVEDDALLRECLAEMLADAGWEVAAVASADAALGHMQVGGRPDVLVTDLWLGAGMNGLALAAEARRRWPGLRAVLTSGADAATLPVHDGDRFLGKPFSMGALVQAVAELAREPVGASARAGCRP